ncbi:histidine ammonia-lyase-like isoform X1 [Dendronephthya gigantea]|uniref:histidine ammonia-lyase-like isoform X1 n=1 Tax=Dendronephthya gigantea TaxID=151771 RepID=UPI0010699F8B|nr:histidine ammonia-lyase-like isoform X1 [Dendronephthya gigantea]
MIVHVKFGDECLVIPCQDGKKSVKWLITEAVKRFRTLQRTTDIPNQPCLYLPNRGGLLWPSDPIESVLKDNGFVEMKQSNEERDEETPGSKVQRGVHTPSTVLLDGSSLTTELLAKLGTACCKIQISDDARRRVKEGRDLVESIVSEGRVVYGINTGFGSFKQKVIPADKLGELQENLIRSHAAGVGNSLTLEQIRMVMALRINVLAKGHSGISLENLDKIVEALNASCLPWIPEQGTLGASGDLAPLAHLALGLMGEGKMWSRKSGWTDAKLVLDSHGLKPIKLGPKEGIAMINGTQLITAVGNEALVRAIAISRQADIIAALSLDCLKGTSRAFDSRIHNLRPHKGQITVAQRLRSVLHSDFYPSKIAESHRFCDKVQDAYTLRCCPQVHGIVLDTIEFVKGILTTEMNSATDNPMIFAESGESISGGNFHGEYPAKALDYLAIGIHELANMSERRIERLVNPAYSGLKYPFLVEDGGLNSGYMVAHYTAAALVSENKVLCHPSSVDSLPTSAGTEDHVSMGGFSARKAVKVVENVERVLAIELLAACQAMEFLRPLTSTEPLEAVHALVRSHVRPWDRDRVMAPEIDKVTELLRSEKVWEVVSPFIDSYMAASSVTDLEIRPPSPTACNIASQVGDCSGTHAGE